jgi:hypothetical protein
MIGRVFDDELSEYERAVNPRIRSDMSKTFSASSPIPYKGFAFGLAIQVVPHYFNMPYSYRLAFFLLPGFVEWAWKTNDNRSHFRAAEFLSWVTAVRTSKAQIEIAKSLPELQGEVTQEAVNLAKPLGGINNVYSQLIKLAEAQSQSSLSSF